MHMPPFADVAIACIQEVQSIACLIILYCFVRQYNHHKRCTSRPLGKPFRLLGNLGSVYMISSILSSSVNGFSNLLKQTSPVQHIVQPILLNLILLSIILLFAFEILRLKTSFDDTIYQVKRTTITLLSSLIMLAVICGVLTKIISRKALNHTLNVNILVAAAFGLSLTASITISSMFATKLFNLMLMQRESKCFLVKGGSGSGSGADHNSGSINISMLSDISVDLTERQRKLLKTITKQTVLSLWQSVIFFIAILYIALVQTKIIFGGNEPNSASYTFFKLFTIFIAGFFNVIPSLCIWLSFAFAKKEYYTICNKCDVCVMNCYQYVAIKSIKKKSTQTQLENNNHQYELMSQTSNK